MKKGGNRIATYLAVVVLLCVYPMIRMATGGGIEQNKALVLPIMWAPAISAIITKLLFDKTARGLGFRRCPPIHLAAAYLLPLLGGGIVYLIAWNTGIGALNREVFARLGIVDWIGLLGVPMSLLTATGEEIGWRGFLVPELNKRFSYTATSLITAAVWCLYHYPLMLFGGYNGGVSILASMIFFSISIIAICFITTWMRLKTGSVWAPALLHAAHNYFIQAVFDPLTVKGPHTAIFTTEFGIGLAVIYSVAAFFYWRRRGELVPEQVKPAQAPA